MNRNQKLRLNTIVGIISQIVAFTCGFIVPRLILNYYGSEVNGLVSSINNFLSFITLAECGIGAVIQSSLYKPLADNNEDEVSRIIISSDRFFKKIGIILSVYVVLLAFVYPLVVDTSYDFVYSFNLILILSISTFVQYYVCMSYRMLITADQRGYIQLLLQNFTQIIITVCSVILAKIGASIHIFKLCSSLVLVLQPILLTLYVKKHYRINKKLPLHDEPIKQKWNGFSQHIAYVVLGNTDTVVLTLMSTLSNVSIYNIYYLVVNGIKTMITAATTGVQSMLGNLYAKGEKETLNKAFSRYEWIMHVAVTILFTCSCILIVPFVRVYTDGVNDACYIKPVFGLLISLAQMSYCLRLPYNAMVFAAGHYKQTQVSALIEAGINIVVSVVLVLKFNLIGVAIGTLAAMLYRSVYLAWYLSKNIINRPFCHFVKHLIVDACIISVSYVLGKVFQMGNVSYVSWILLAIKVFLIVLAVTIAFNIIFYPQIIKLVFKKIKSKQINK